MNLPSVPAEEPVAQEPPEPAEKFILRGTAIHGDNKTALIQKIIPDENSIDDTLILKTGDVIGGRRVVDISADSVTFDDGAQLRLDLDDS